MSSSGEWTVYVGLLLLVLLLQMGLVVCQDDYSGPITCFFCYGKAENSSCSDPIDVYNNPHVTKKVCLTGVCVKWTRYKKGVLYMERTCSQKLNFHLTMIDGVCRTERNGNGYLCMCGKHLCNNVPIGARVHSKLYYIPFLLLALFLVDQFTDGFHLVPH